MEASPYNPFDPIIISSTKEEVIYCVPSSSRKPVSLIAGAKDLTTKALSGEESKFVVSKSKLPGGRLSRRLNPLSSR